MTNTRISRSDDLNTIKEKYGERYFDNPEARREVCDFWGVESNEQGVIKGFKKETLVEVGRCKGNMKYIETKSGHVLLGLDASTAIGGFGYAPSIWNGLEFTSYWNAREFAVQEFISYFNREALSQNSCSSISNRMNARKAAESLRSELTHSLTYSRRFVCRLKK